ncbi:MAG: hypothetical protein WC444_05595 [Candidatus Paceibacterota bacterium]
MDITLSDSGCSTAKKIHGAGTTTTITVYGTQISEKLKKTKIIYIEKPRAPSNSSAPETKILDLNCEDHTFTITGVLTEDSSSGEYYTELGRISTVKESRDDLLSMFRINEVKQMIITDDGTTSTYSVIFNDLTIDKAPHDIDTPYRYDFTLTVREALNTITPTI